MNLKLFLDIYNKNEVYICLLLIILILYTNPPNVVRIILSFFVVFMIIHNLTNLLSLSLIFAVIILVLLSINLQKKLFDLPFSSKQRAIENFQDNIEPIKQDLDNDKSITIDSNKLNTDMDFNNDKLLDNLSKEVKNMKKMEQKDDEEQDEDLFDRVDNDDSESDSDTDDDSDIEDNENKKIKSLGKSKQIKNTNKKYYKSQEKLYNLNKSMVELRNTLHTLAPTLKKGEKVLNIFKNLDITNMG